MSVSEILGLNNLYLKNCDFCHVFLKFSSIRKKKCEKGCKEEDDNVEKSGELMLCLFFFFDKKR